MTNHVTHTTFFHGIPRPEESLVANTQGKALTIGNFDGVHLGHQAMLAELNRLANEHQLSSAVLSFEPHPRDFFARSNPEVQAPKRISTLRDKFNALSQYGISQVFIQRFNAQLASLEPQVFVKRILVDALQVKQLIVGDDFRFGAKRAGDFSLLNHLGKTYGFDVHAMPSILYQGSRVSSSNIRTHLEQGELDQVTQLMGRPYLVSGRVVHGKKLGRTLGFPTLNLRPPPLALHGIYIVKVHGLGSEYIKGVASVGVRPSVDSNGEYWLEVHLLDFNQEVYGKLVKVEFVKKLRDEKKFDSLDSLVNAIQTDVQTTRNYFELSAQAIDSQPILNLN